MSLDRYTKVVLTVIAACLVWLSVGGPSLITPLEAQVGDRVIISGWVDASGETRRLPLAYYDDDSPAARGLARPLPILQTNK